MTKQGILNLFHAPHFLDPYLKKTLYKTRNVIIWILNPSTNSMRVPGPPPLYVCHIYRKTSAKRKKRSIGYFFCEKVKLKRRNEKDNKFGNPFKIAKQQRVRDRELKETLLGIEGLEPSRFLTSTDFPLTINFIVAWY